MAGSPKDIDALDAEGLKGLLLQALEENAALRAEVAAVREENRRLRGLKGPPDAHAVQALGNGQGDGGATASAG